MRACLTNPAAAIAALLLLVIPMASFSGDVEKVAGEAVTAAKDKTVEALKEKAGDTVKAGVAEVTGAEAGAAEAGVAAMPEMSPEMAAMFEAYQKAGALGPEHEQLKYFEGRWTAAVSMWFGSGEPVRGEAKASTGMSLGGRFAHMHYEGEWMGQPFSGLGYTGYDNVNRQYSNLWADSASTWFVVMHGDYDVDSRTYTFRGMMPNPLDATSPTPVREVTRILDENRYSVEWFEPNEGEDVRTMRIEFTRVAADTD